MTGCSVAKATRQRLRGGSDSPLLARITPAQPGSGDHPVALAQARPRSYTAANHGSFPSAYWAAVASSACSSATDRFTARYSCATAGSAVSQSRNNNAQRQFGASLTLTWRLTLWPGSALPCNRLRQGSGSAPSGCGVSCSNRRKSRKPGRGQGCRQLVGDLPGWARSAADPVRPWPASPGSRWNRCDPPARPARRGTPWRQVVGRRPPTAADGRPAAGPPRGARLPQPGVPLERQQPVRPTARPLGQPDRRGRRG